MLIDSIFSQPVIPTIANKSTTAAPSSATQQPVKTATIASATTVRIPSIRQALAGNSSINKVEETAPASITQSKNDTTIDHEFTETDLLAFWPEYADQYKSEPHLYNTLSSQPKLKTGNVIEFDAENSVQLDQFRGLKHEITGFFMRKLRNSKIIVDIVLSKALPEAKSLTEDNKLQDMMKKNPALLTLRQKFSLDYA